MSTSPACSVCGRPLINPASVAAGVGPICGGRSYTSRISARHSSRMGGWGGRDAWESYNRPCYTCTQFVFPKEGEEREIGDGFLVYMTVDGQRYVETFDDLTAIGGYCKAVSFLIDANVTCANSFCGGDSYQRREDKKKAMEALISTPSGQLSVLLNEAGEIQEIGEQK